MQDDVARLPEARFGPESDPIDVAQFARTALNEETASIQALDSQWSAIPDDRKAALATECSIHDLKNEVEKTWNDPTLSSFLLKEHDRITLALQPDKNKSSRPTRSAYLLAPDTLPPEARMLQETINNIQLSSWVFPLNTSAFIRTPRNSDQNAFETLKFNVPSQAANATIDDAVVIITQAFLSSQTLQDICRTIPCAPFATRVASDDSIQNYGIEDHHAPYSVICIEGVAYGEGGEDDGSRKLIDHLAANSKTSIRRASSSLSETTISLLPLRVNEPYWMLHRGNCEHFIVVEQIRALHPSDPLSGYPITLQQTPRLLDICRACEKSPAVWSIVNDDRLGESPSLLCAPCWSNMGLPDSSGNESIEIIPLLAHIP